MSRRTSGHEQMLLGYEVLLVRYGWPSWNRSTDLRSEGVEGTSLYSPSVIIVYGEVYKANVSLYKSW